MNVYCFNCGCDDWLGGYNGAYPTCRECATPMPAISEYLTLDEAGARLGLDPETVRQYIRRGLLRGENLGVRVLASEVERYERERRPAHRPPKTKGEVNDE